MAGGEEKGVGGGYYGEKGRRKEEVRCNGKREGVTGRKGR